MTIAFGSQGEVRELRRIEQHRGSSTRAGAGGRFQQCSQPLSIRGVEQSEGFGRGVLDGLSWGSFDHVPITLHEIQLHPIASRSF